MAIPAHPAFVKTISAKVETQLPAFVSADHRKFVTFLQKYYTWLEQEGNAAEIIGNLLAYSDVDQTIDNFIGFFHKQFAVDFPKEHLVDKNWLIKNIRTFYRARGAQDSFKFLFRVLFNDTVSFRFPGDELLRASDGKWVQDQISKTTWTTGVQSLEGRKITGDTSGATAVLEQVINTTEGGGTIAEMKLSNIDGILVIGETVRGNDIDGNTVSFDLEGMLDAITVTNPGNNYSVGDPVLFNPATAGSTTLAALVSELTTGFVSGSIITDGGSGFVVGEYLNLTSASLDQFGIEAKIRVFSESAGVITGLFIENAGRGYSGLPTTNGTGTITGTGATITFQGTNVGGVKNINIPKFGFGITELPNINFTGSGDGNATAIAITRAVITADDGRFITTDSLLDSNRVLQDNDFFQDYSYVVKSATTFADWEPIVRKLLHPAGTKLFPQISTDQVTGAPFVQFMMSVAQELELILFPPGDSTAYLDMQLSLIAPLMLLLLSTDPDATDRELGMNWNFFEEMNFSHAGFSPTKWGTKESAGWSVEHFKTLSIDFLNANRYSFIRQIPQADVIEAVAIEDFEDTASPNTAAWNSAAATGARSSEQAVVGTQSFKFSGSQVLKEEAVVAANDTRKLQFHFYASSTGTDGTTDKTRIAALYESASSEGAAVYLTNSGGNRFLGASDGIVTSANSLSIAQDQWYFVEFTVQNNTFELKVDNAIIDTGIATDANLMNRFELGHATDESANFISYFDAVRAYDRLRIK